MLWLAFVVGLFSGVLCGLISARRRPGVIAPWRFVVDLLWLERRKLSVGMVQYDRGERPRLFTASRFGFILSLPARHLFVVWR